jgi:endo-1,4-beta-xylanase
MAGMVRACLAVPACDSVTFWGLNDEVSWLNWFLAPNLDPLLFDASLRPKPAYFAVRDVLLEGRPGVP